MRRRLTLRGEPLAELTSGELSQVDGGVPATPACPHSHDCPTQLDCLLSRLSVPRYCP